MTNGLSRFLRPSKFQEATGYTVQAVEAKIKRGVWLEGFEFVRAPDGNILVDMVGFERWALGERLPASKRPR